MTCMPNSAATPSARNRLPVSASICARRASGVNGRRARNRGWPPRRECVTGRYRQRAIARWRGARRNALRSAERPAHGRGAIRAATRRPRSSCRPGSGRRSATAPSTLAKRASMSASSYTWYGIARQFVLLGPWREAIAMAVVIAEAEIADGAGRGRTARTAQRHEATIEFHLPVGPGRYRLTTMKTRGRTRGRCGQSGHGRGERSVHGIAGHRRGVCAPPLSVLKRAPGLIQVSE